jgi:hypothetical protein
LAEQLIDEGRLAVVDVGDNGDIAQVHKFQSSVQRARRAAAGSRMGMTLVSLREFAGERPTRPHNIWWALSQLQHHIYESD